MVILGIDTSHVEGGVCLDDGISPPTCARFGATSSHLVELGFCVDRVLGERRMQPADITRIALVEGPGSFTGLRIGMAYAKGLAAALDVEIVTVGTLELLSLPFLRPDPGSTVSTSDDTGKESAVCAMVDARKGEIYGAVYARSRDGSGKHSLSFGLAELVSPCAEAPGIFVGRAKQFDPLYVGSGTIQYRAALEEINTKPTRVASPEQAAPSTAYLCGIARELAPLSHEAVSSLEPRYVRSSDAVLKPLKPINPHE